MDNIEKSRQYPITAFHEFEDHFLNSHTECNKMLLFLNFVDRGEKVRLGIQLEDYDKANGLIED